MSRYLIVGAGRSGINAAQLLIKVGEDFILSLIHVSEPTRPH